MRVRWTPEALQDRLDVWDHVAAQDPKAAARLDRRFATAIRHLGRFPELGRPGLVAGTREILPHPSYRIVYEVEDGTLWILAVVHTARLWPPVRDDDPT